MLISKFVLFMSINIVATRKHMSNDMIYVHASRDDDSSSGEREDVSKRSMGATNKSNRILSFSDSEADDNDRFTLYTIRHLNL